MNEINLKIYIHNDCIIQTREKKKRKSENSTWEFESKTNFSMKWKGKEIENQFPFSLIIKKYI